MCVECGDCKRYGCGKNDSQESPNAEKLDEMPDYETANGVVDKGDTRIPPNDKHYLIHPDSLLKIKQGRSR